MSFGDRPAIPCYRLGEVAMHSGGQGKRAWDRNAIAPLNPSAPVNPDARISGIVGGRS